MKSSAVVFSLLLAAVINFGFSRAEQIHRPVSLESLANAAELVVRGTVASKSCQRDGSGRIYTRIQLDITEVWKGDVPPNFSIVHGGGILGEERVTVSGQVQLEIGEEVVLFLVLNQRGEGVSIGLGQGKFRIEKDAKSGELCAHNPFQGDRRASNEMNPLSPHETSRLTVSALKSLVRGGRL
jgi:hypothetical protein